MTKTYLLTETLSLAQTENDTTSIVEKEPEIHTINYRTVTHAERIALEKGKPLHTTWYEGSKTGDVFVGEVVKNPENPKYTTYLKYLINRSDSGYHKNLIEKIYKINEDFIIVTYFAVFIVSGKIKKRQLIRN
jgi:hypothetical protein